MAKKKKVVVKSKASSSKRVKKATPQATGVRNAIAKAFPTFAKALAVKQVDTGNTTNKKLKPVIPMTPTVDLLPADYTIGRTISNVRRGTAIAGTGIAAALAIVFFAQGAVINIAEQAKITVEAQVNEANLRVETFKETSQLYSVLNDRKDILDNIDKNRPEYYAGINELYAKLPAGSNLVNIEIQYVSLAISGEIEGEPTGVVCGPIADPFASETRPISACISFSGIALNRADVSTYATLLSESGLFSNVVVGKSTEAKSNQTGVAFSGTAALLRDIDPSVILESQPPVVPANPNEGELQAPTIEGIPAGVLLDPNDGMYYTEDRAFQYLVSQNTYIELATGNVYAASLEDGSVDIGSGPIGTVIQEGVSN